MSHIFSIVFHQRQWSRPLRVNTFQHETIHAVNVKIELITLNYNIQRMRLTNG